MYRCINYKRQFPQSIIHHSKCQVQFYDRLSIKQPFLHFWGCTQLVSRLHLFVEPMTSLATSVNIRGKNSPSSINLKFGSILSAGVFNNETATKFTREIVHMIFSLHTLVYMNSRRGLVWPTCRSTCFAYRTIDKTLSY